MIKFGERQWRQSVERSEYMILSRPVVRVRCQQVHITETVLTQIGWEGVHWNYVAQDGGQKVGLVGTAMNPGLLFVVRGPRS